MVFASNGMCTRMIFLPITELPNAISKEKPMKIAQII